MAGTSSEVVIGGRRVSKKRKSNSKNNHQLIQRSFANELQDDMWIQIFLRLPVISLILFKSVCKRWFNLITSPLFIQLRSQVPNMDSTSGLFLQRRTFSVTYDFAAFDTRFPKNKIVSKASFPFGSNRNRRDTLILQSCNGLLLCFVKPSYQLYVYNPSTNHFKMLPADFVKPVSIWSAIHMVFDPTKSPHYKVTCVEALQEIGTTSFVRIQTYSSETCNWSVHSDRLHMLSFYGFTGGVYWIDGIYWINMQMGLLFKLDTVNLQLTVIPTPENLRLCVRKLHLDPNLFVSRDSLLFLFTCNDIGFLMVYEMKNGYSEWLLKYLINLHYIFAVFREGKDLDMHVMPNIKFRCVVLEEREEDSFMVLELCGKVVRYKMEPRTLHELSDVGEICISMETHECHCFPFIPSFAGV